MKTLTNQFKNFVLAAAFAVSLPGLAQDHVAAGKKVFTDNCAACHSLDAQVVGPALKGVTERRDEAWVKNFIKNSTKLIQSGDKEAVALFEKFNKTQMPAFEGSLSEEQVTSVVAYLANPGEAAPAEAAAPATDNKATAAASVPAPEFNLQAIDPILLVLVSFALILLLVILGFGLIILKQVSPLLAKVYEKPAYQNSFMARLVAMFQGEGQLFVKKDKNIIMEGHDYDGIHEFDNDLPPWWRYLFYATVVFSLVYVVNYHVMGGKLQDAEYEAEMQTAALLHPPTEEGSINEKTDYKVLTDAGALEKGKTAYLQNCAACHGQEAEGKIGPNLTDEYWLHGGEVNEIFKTIKFGITEKGMVAWNGKLSKDQILEVSSYILSLQGSNPAGAKEPQGEKVTK
ncbi:c-type cytochrome [Adhaeribacter rhizoryzae]|uniref:C-type cytochrome n=1 Tax=Adhaeribacter rhizoryzae TaxID=2607907 RepID=A0A5M6D5T9_9BACT|nr:c-type cytochrome [Adhaeribacter rhizoryzae]KAA5541159.1 c-type cytochrome [Adhaeribacter rhizoryzae]